MGVTPRYLAKSDCMARYRVAKIEYDEGATASAHHAYVSSLQMELVWGGEFPDRHEGAGAEKAAEVGRFHHA